MVFLFLQEADTGKEDASLDKEEFAEFFKSIATRQEIVEIMETSPYKTHMDARDFQTFLEEKQGVSHGRINNKGAEILLLLPPRAKLNIVFVLQTKLHSDLLQTAGKMPLR